MNFSVRYHISLLSVTVLIKMSLIETISGRFNFLYTYISIMAIPPEVLKQVETLTHDLQTLKTELVNKNKEISSIRAALGEISRTLCEYHNVSPTPLQHSEESGVHEDSDSSVSTSHPSEGSGV